MLNKQIVCSICSDDWYTDEELWTLSVWKSESEFKSKLLSDHSKADHFWTVSTSDSYWKKSKTFKTFSDLYDSVQQLKQNHLDLCNDHNWDC